MKNKLISVIAALSMAVTTLGGMATVAHAETTWNYDIDSDTVINDDVVVPMNKQLGIGYYNRCVVIINGSLTLEAGTEDLWYDAEEDEWDDFGDDGGWIYPFNGSLLIINGDLNVNKKCDAYVYNYDMGSRIIVTGSINNNGGEVEKGVITTSLSSIGYVADTDANYEYFTSGGKVYTFNGSEFVETTLDAVAKSTPATATYANVGDYPAQFAGDTPASAWSVTVTPGSDTIENIDVKVNGQSSNEGAWNGMNITGGTVVFGVAVNLAADAVNSVTAVVNGSDVTTTRVTSKVVE